MAKRVYFSNIPIDLLTMEETVALIDRKIQENAKIQQISLNMVKFAMLYEKPELFNAVRNADIVNVDGQGFLYALRLLNIKPPQRIAGIDLMFRLFELAKSRNYKVFLLGARPDVVETMARKIAEIYGDNIIAGYHHGYFTKNEEAEIVEKINKSGAQILLIGISSPKKELFVKRNKEKLDVNFIMGVGGSFDVVADKVKRAPGWMQKIGLEWLYRFLQEPFRFRKFMPYLIKFAISFWDMQTRRRELIHSN